MKVLILGYSQLVKNKILPFFRKYKINYSISSRSQLINDNFCKNKFNCYNEALNFSKADIVYISLANINHFFWAKKALEKNYHVIVDKPITLNIDQVKYLVNIAKIKNWVFLSDEKYKIDTGYGLNPMNRKFYSYYLSTTNLIKSSADFA